MSDRITWVGMRAAGIVALSVLLGLAGGAAAAGDQEKAGGQEKAEGKEKAAAPRMSPRTVKLGGATVGMTVEQAGWALEANGFRRSPSAQRRYIDDTSDVSKRIRFRELPGPDGTLTIYELDETAWYRGPGLTADRHKAEAIERFGEPKQILEPSVGRVDLVYSDVSGAPTVIEVIEACRADLQKKDPKLSAEEAEKQASSASQYRAANDQIEKTCPGAAAKYKQMADGLEAPRMTVVIRSGRIDTMVRWPRIEADLVRWLGQEKAARVMAFGVKELEEEPSGQ